jgi:DNA-binding CsgD family transcriptional regulator
MTARRASGIADWRARLAAKRKPDAPALHFAKGILAAGTSITPPTIGGRLSLPADEIIEKWRAGKGAPEIAEEYNCSSQSIYRLLMRFGINGKGRPRGPRNNAARIADDAARLYLEGKAIIEVAAELDVSRTAVTKALALANVEIRNGKKNDHRIDRIMEMRSGGATLEEIGNELGITRERVRQLVILAGKKDDFAERPLRPEEIAAAAEYEAGGSLYFVAAKLGVGQFAARAVILKAGFKIRPGKMRNWELARQRAEEVARRYRAGEPAAEIAAALGFKKGEQIYRYFGLAGIKPNRKPQHSAQSVH